MGLAAHALDDPGLGRKARCIAAHAAFRQSCTAPMIRIVRLSPTKPFAMALITYMHETFRSGSTTEIEPPQPAQP